MSNPYRWWDASMEYWALELKRARAACIALTVPKDDPAYLRAKSWLWFTRRQASASCPASAASEAGLPPAT